MSEPSIVPDPPLSTDTDTAERQGRATEPSEVEGSYGTTPADQAGSSSGTGGNPATRLQDNAVIDDDTPFGD